MRLLESGSQDRPAYRIKMELWEAAMKGDPSYPEWKWGFAEGLRPGMAAGSLCCRLALQHEGRGG